MKHINLMMVWLCPHNPAVWTSLYKRKSGAIPSKEMANGIHTTSTDVDYWLSRSAIRNMIVN